MEANDVKDPEKLYESISALVDDELSISERQTLMINIKNDATLLNKWRHFYIIKTIMRQHVLHSGLSTDEFVRKVLVHAEKSENPLLNNQQNTEC